MFKKLHCQMTVFCTLITSTILIALTCICILISERSLTNNIYNSFFKDINAMIIHLQSQSTISLQWVNQLQENSRFLLLLYDNGKPLFSQQLYSDNKEHELEEACLSYAKETFGMDISDAKGSKLPSHEEFTFTGEDGSKYYISAGTIPKAKNTLGFLLLYPLSGQQRQIYIQRLLFTGVNLAAIFLLSLFSWFFTGRMLLPLEESKKRQTQFISAASHELRTPLSVMLSGAEALEKSTTQEERGHFLHMIQDEGTRMRRLISDMLLLANSDSGSFSLQKSPCQPDELLLEVYEKFEFSAKKNGISLFLSLPEASIPDCDCDSERITQVLSILLDNAISYTPSGGKIALSLSLLDASESGRNFCFSVSDTGPGIPEEETTLIFERFYRSEKSRADKNHFGLGLCIAKEIVLAHRGKIYVENNKNGGAVFVVEL